MFLIIMSNWFVFNILIIDDHITSVFKIWFIRVGQNLFTFMISYFNNAVSWLLLVRKSMFGLSNFWYLPLQTRRYFCPILSATFNYREFDADEFQ